jgi:hypothetical protein
VSEPVFPGSSFPTVALQWSPTTSAGDGYSGASFENLTDRLRSWTWTQGRNDETSDFQPGQGNFVLNNDDRELDPLNTAGSWYGNIKPRRLFLLTLNPGVAGSIKFLGYSRGYPQRWQDPTGVGSYVSIDVVDIGGLLNGLDLAVGFTRPEELSGARIIAVLDALGISSDQYDVDDGTVTVAAIDVDQPGTSGLAHVREVARAEGGQFYTVAETFRFRDRRRRLNPNLSSAVTFTDAAGTSTGGTQAVLPYSPDLEVITSDDTYLYNSSVITGPGTDDVAGTASDATSIDKYLTISRNDATQLASEPDRTALAQWNVWRYKEPDERLRGLSVNLAPLSQTKVAFAFSRLPNTLVKVERFADSASPMELYQWVERIAHDCRPGVWTINLETSPADLTEYWTIEDSTLGSIDGGARIAP